MISCPAGGFGVAYGYYCQPNSLALHLMASCVIPLTSRQYIGLGHKVNTIIEIQRKIVIRINEMFTQAIEIASKFTRAIHSISRNYRSQIVVPSAVTLFFINSDGWAFTCGHVATRLRAEKMINQKAEHFREELNSLKGKKKERTILRELEKKYGYSKTTTFELVSTFMNCVEGDDSVQVKIIKHNKYDVALIKFKDYTKLLCASFPVFPSDTSGLQPGKLLSRLGYPFPEFANFAYDESSDKIVWTEAGRQTTPLFPIEGMVTRRLADDEENIYGFEMSTPGLRGQSGGPAFDADGKVWGMQFQTKHLDLNFDIDQEVLRKGIKKRVKDSPFLHAGDCIHIDILKSFMRDNGVQFTEA